MVRGIRTAMNSMDELRTLQDCTVHCMRCCIEELQIGRRGEAEEFYRVRGLDATVVDKSRTVCTVPTVYSRSRLAQLDETVS